MSLDNYNRTKVIGKGSYGEVWLSKHKMDRKQVQMHTTCHTICSNSLYFAAINWLCLHSVNFPFLVV